MNLLSFIIIVRILASDISGNELRSFIGLESLVEFLLTQCVGFIPQPLVTQH